jgi:sulfide dehydrogenase cytochrome subunit
MKTPGKRTVPAVAALMALFLASAGYADTLSQGAMLSASCEGCHGTDGRSPGSIPDISGKSSEFIRLTLQDFRSGDRSSTMMGRHVKGYTDEEILLIADHFGQQGQDTGKDDHE